MEDAHIASPGFTFDSDAPISVFGVFDGHGGKTHRYISNIPERGLFLKYHFFSLYRQRSFQIC